jgi:peptidoglycan lytic transglycosylase
LKRRLTIAALLAGVLALGILGRHALYRLYFGVRYESIILREADSHKVSPHLVAAVIFHESRFRHDAKSSVGALGLMQLMPETAVEMAERESFPNFRVNSLYEPEINIRLGTRYLGELVQRFPTEMEALAAYNAGPTRVEQWMRSGSGIPFAETKAYVRNVLKSRKTLEVLYPEWHNSGDRDS